MIAGFRPVVQALLGTLLTWFVTGLGAALVFLVDHGTLRRNQRKIMATSLGFAGGVMLSASYFSLLSPCVELSKSLWGDIHLVPVCFGFLLGAFFVHLTDVYIDKMGLVGVSPGVALAVANSQYSHKKMDYYDDESCNHSSQQLKANWKRIVLLIVAITVHNIPEGLAVGVGFGAIGHSAHATYSSAVSLTIGIALQNFPEGLAVSLPLLASGFSPLKSFFYGQLSGVVEPFAGVIGAVGVNLFQPVLPWALSFAAGAMVFVVLSEVVIEAHQNSSSISSWSAILGFTVMMALDVGLG
ncbi:unnamed protein product [Allacma fusca]|uniref:Zinc transporter ZIP11 n=1 Tax=Allacma fusca TaxID=39272 RepID=A0A8J2P087_9HEXA|nr:unnamed protein product [Allacma fusca]